MGFQLMQLHITHLLILFNYCGCQSKIPDIEKCLDSVATSQAKRVLVRFMFCHKLLNSVKFVLVKKYFAFTSEENVLDMNGQIS
ncbi:hypothetical protein Fmac_013382 [Flemingia macrophylla]|uniref:Secreted protein n=1 Tax=Flemingia macrophylla TaxID=520843 RepID=A0ABD1MSZ1_9FABA